MAKKALCIGINDYPGTQNDLSGCVNDANDWAAEWGTRFKGRANGAFTYYALKTLHEQHPAIYDAWFAAIRTYLPSTRLPQSPQILGSAVARRFKVFD